MNLSEKLKTIYTASDSFTVLQLLKKLIEELEDVEVDTVSLYHHRVTLSFGGPVGTVDFISSRESPYTQLSELADVLMLPKAIPALPYEGQINYYAKVGGTIKQYAVNGDTLTEYTATSINTDVVTSL